MKIAGLECDHCDYKDMTIKREEYEGYIDHPCPKCGHSLLTQKDYDAVLVLEDLERMSIEYGWPLDHITVKLHGDGLNNADIGIK